MSDTQALLLVASGTADEEAISAYKAIEKEISRQYPTAIIRWSYTSSIIRAKLEKQGTPIPSIGEHISEFSGKGIRSVRIQPLYIAAGEEFSRMERELIVAFIKNYGCFDHAYLGRPLLESEKDRDETVTALLSQFPKERAKDEAILFMAHGQSDGRGDLPLEALEEGLRRQDPLVFMATLEGGKTFDHALLELRQKGVKTVWLCPLLLVAGYHVSNNLAGNDATSWASRLTQEGFSIKTALQGMGDNPYIRAIFSRHATEATDDLIPLCMK